MRNINSLKNTSEFKEVYENGKSFANRLMAVYVLEKEGSLKIGISVSKKVGNSVERHRAARLIRESWTAVKENLPENLRIVVVARPCIREKSETQVEEAFKAALKRLGF